MEKWSFRVIFFLTLMYWSSKVTLGFLVVKKQMPSQNNDMKAGMNKYDTLDPFPFSIFTVTRAISMVSCLIFRQNLDLLFLRSDISCWKKETINAKQNGDSSAAIFVKSLKIPKQCGLPFPKPCHQPKRWVHFELWVSQWFCQTFFCKVSVQCWDHISTPSLKPIYCRKKETMVETSSGMEEIWSIFQRPSPRVLLNSHGTFALIQGPDQRFNKWFERISKLLFVIKE